MKKKIITLIVIITVLLCIGGGVFFLLNRQNSYSYSIEEEKWIEKNKNSSIDIYMPSDIAALTLSGEGIFFDFVEDFNKNTGVKLNPLAYQLGNEISSDYSILLVDEALEDDITILDDEYVVISKNIDLENNTNFLSSKKIGLIKTEEEVIKNYLGINNTYTLYDTKEALINALKNDEVEYIVGLKFVYLNDILTNNYHINYHVSDLKKKYVLRLNGNKDEEKSIIKKEFQKFKDKKFNKSYNKHLLNIYINIFKISEQDITNLNSKTYTYGYINNGIYDYTKKGKFSGINYYIIKNFASFANVDMKYADEYKSLDELNNAFNNGKIDFYFDTTSFNFDKETGKTVLPVNSKVVILVKNSDKISIKNIASLKSKEVSTIENSKIEKYLKDNNVNVNSFKNYKSLLKNKKNSILAMDLSNYEFYKSRGLEGYHIACILNEEQNYGFIVNDNNKIFYNLFNFYLEFFDYNSVVNIDYINTYEYEGLNIFLLIAVIALIGILILQFLGKIKKAIKVLFTRKNKTISKEEKLKYIDSLTSLKNRVYLNDNIEKWDNSEIYPQIIVVIDLNNISYINDNYGHEEGDKVIAEAANILIQTQMPNTEIIRTDGNEFLVYMIDYEEKKAVSYIRKLNREFKNLTHGYGAAIGYSIINDAIKTIDDAVNEATLDMKTNKELMNEENK